MRFYFSNPLGLWPTVPYSSCYFVLLPKWTSSVTLGHKGRQWNSTTLSGAMGTGVAQHRTYKKIK